MSSTQFNLSDFNVTLYCICNSHHQESKLDAQPYIPTPGIDVGTYNINRVGRLSIWDAAGHIEFHFTHGLFLASRNSMAVVVYNLKHDDAVEVSYAFKNIQYAWAGVKVIL